MCNYGIYVCMYVCMYTYRHAQTVVHIVKQNVQIEFTEVHTCLYVYNYYLSDCSSSVQESLTFEYYLKLPESSSGMYVHRSVATFVCTVHCTESFVNIVSISAKCFA